MLTAQLWAAGLKPPDAAVQTLAHAPMHALAAISTLTVMRGAVCEVELCRLLSH